MRPSWDAWFWARLVAMLDEAGYVIVPKRDTHLAQVGKSARAKEQACTSHP